MAKTSNKKRKVVVEANGQAHINATFNNINNSLTKSSFTNDLAKPRAATVLSISP